MTLPNFTVVRVLNGPNCREVFLDEHSTETGALIRSVSLSSGTNRFALELGVQGQGVLSRSVDGRFLSLIGYDCAAGAAYSARDRRIIARVDADGGVDTSTVIPQFDYRVACAASIDGSRYWLSGGFNMSRDGGVLTMAHGTVGNATPILDQYAEVRAIVLRGHLLYFSTPTVSLPNDGGMRAGGVFLLGDAGTARLDTASRLPNIDGQGPGNFAFVDGANATVYVADRIGIEGVRRYTDMRGLWSKTARFLPGLRDGGQSVQRACSFVAAQRVGSDVVILCVAREGTTDKIVRFIDPGGEGGDVDAGVTLVLAADGAQYLGVAF